MGERRTAREAVMSQTCHGGGNIYGRERSTVSETFPLQFFYGGGNVYRSERRTIGETVFFQACYGRWNIYGSERSTTCVFASLLLSIIYILNGRKVIAWIL